MTYLNVVEIESALFGLAKTYPSAAHLIELPNPTAQQKVSHALRIGNGTSPANGVLLISGVHAREWGGPDILISLAADLLRAWSKPSGLAYGATEFTASEIQKVINRVELIVFPDVNPDGRHYVQTTPADPMWRKNRNPDPDGTGIGNAIGVDINRNYDFLFDFEVEFHPDVVKGNVVASSDSHSEIYHGREAFSEPETANVRWLFDEYPSITRFIDIHSSGGSILRSWGDDDNQTTDPTQNFMNAAFKGQRGIEGDTYGEFIQVSDLQKSTALGQVMQSAIAGVRGELYSVAQSFLMPGWPTAFPTSGASDDWAFSRHQTNSSTPNVLSYTLEFNRATGVFAPTWEEMERIISDVDAGLVAFCLDAAKYPTIQPPRWWHRVFPPELWGPYGPWSKLRAKLLSIRTIGIRRAQR